MAKMNAPSDSKFAPHAKGIRQMVKSGLSDSKAFTAVAAIVAQQGYGPSVIDAKALGQAILAAGKARSAARRAGESDISAIAAGLAAAFGTAMAANVRSTK
jgi:hypothetical protein